MPTASFLKEQGFLSWERSDVPATIAGIIPGSPAEELGLQTNDTILSINNKIISSLTIWQELQRKIWQEITIAYERWEKLLSVQHQCPDDSCVLGIALEGNNNIQISPIQFPFPQSVGAGRREMGAQTSLTFNALGTLGKNLLSFNGDKVNDSLNKLTGPVWAVKFGDMLRQSWGWIAFLAFGWIISLALALFNVLPIPALDGGRLLGVLIQRVGRLKAEKYFTIEWYLNVIFFILLMGLGVYIIFKDLVQFWGVSLPFIG